MLLNRDEKRPEIPPETQRNNCKGSPQPGEPLFLAIGRLRRPHGVKGEIIMEVLTNFPDRLHANMLVCVGEEHELHEIEQLRSHNKAVIIKFTGLDDRDQVGRLRNEIVYLQSADYPELPEGEYYYFQLLGLLVLDESGKELGYLVEILETGANDVYVVRSADGNEILLPAIHSVILEVNLDRREIRVHPPEWL